jgi:hypothetical protein
VVDYIIASKKAQTVHLVSNMLHFIVMNHRPFEVSEQLMRNDHAVAATAGCMYASAKLAEDFQLCLKGIG